MARLASGEIGVISEGREYNFRPSFRALDDLNQFQSVYDIWYKLQHGCIESARFVMEFFYQGEPSDLNHLIGCHSPVDGFLIESKGDIPDDEMLVLALALLRNALQGKDGVKSKSKEDEMQAPKMDAMEYVWSAHKNLGLSLDEAWSMTMHEFMAGMVATFPDAIVDTEKENAKTAELMRRIYGDDA